MRWVSDNARSWYQENEEVEIITHDRLDVALLSCSSNFGFVPFLSLVFLGMLSTAQLDRKKP